MKKTIALLVLVAAIALTTVVVLLAQTTAPASTIDFSLLFRPPSDPRPVEHTAGYFRWWNLRGSTDTLVTADSAGVDTLSTALTSRGRPVCAVLADSSELYRLYGSSQRYWTITITDTTRFADSTHHTGYVGLRITDVYRGHSKDTTLLVSDKGLMCPGIVMDSVISVMLAPFDSIRVGDRTGMFWITSKWQ